MRCCTVHLGPRPWPALSNPHLQSGVVGVVQPACSRPAEGGTALVLGAADSTAVEVHVVAPCTAAGAAGVAACTAAGRLGAFVGLLGNHTAVQVGSHTAVHTAAACGVYVVAVPMVQQTLAGCDPDCCYAARLACPT